ncbi:HNH endonuclease, partial [Geodermatophilus sp. SYSU D01180]
MPEATSLTVRRLRARALALALLQEADAAAIDARRERAERHADVRLYDCPFDGMATFAADLPADVAAACSALIDELARMLEADGDPRPIGQLRTLVYADLLQRPWETGRPPVTAHLQVIAPLG